MPRKPYEEIYNCFKEKGCCLYLSEEEYNKLKSPIFQVVSYKASCGHDNTVTLTNFIHKNTGIFCKECTIQNVSQKLRELNVSNEILKTIEYNGFKAISNLLEEEFDIEKTNEGCLADMIIKPKYEKSDKWMQIQLKITSKLCHNLYTFSFHNQIYENCLIICYCIEDSKIWTFYYTEVYERDKINIGRTSKSEFAKNLISIDKFNDYIHFEYVKCNKFNEDICMIPIALSQQQEVIYRKYREDNIPYLKYEYPLIEAGKTDFMINNFKIQEKVASKRKDRKEAYVANIRRTSYSSKIQTKKSYILGDNDFYWIWLKNEFNKFFIIPEKVLYDMDIISDNNEIHTGKMIYLTLDGWAKRYLYDMTKDDFKEKIMRLFRVNE